MKRQITLEQWNELSKAEKIKIINSDSERYHSVGEIMEMESCPCCDEYLPDIGQLIEYLGDDLIKIGFKTKEIVIRDKSTANGIKVISFEEPIDGCFKATKHKLRV